MNAQVIAGLVSLWAAPAPAAAAFDPLAAITVYDGTWRTEVSRVASEFSLPGHERRILRNRCWRGGVFYACAQEANGKPGGLVVYTWDEASRGYNAYSIPPGGGPAGTGRLLISGDDWVFPWDQQVAGATVHFRVVNHFVGRDRIEYRREFSRDGEAWTLIEQGVEVRQADAG